MPLSWLGNLFSRGRPALREPAVLPVEEQAEAWRAALRKMKWAIRDEELRVLVAPPPLTQRDLDEGFRGVALFYGFGDDAGKAAWDYARRQRRPRVWQSPYIHFERPDSFRLRPGAPPRPRGFYLAKVHLGERSLRKTVSEARRGFNAVTGFGPEGLQLLCVTHPHLAEMMSERKMPFMALADYDVAPHGFNDFFDVPQMFSSNRILGLGIGNVGQDYRGFGVPTLRLHAPPEKGP
jgi:hypothetical protein